MSTIAACGRVSGKGRRRCRSFTSATTFVAAALVILAPAAAGQTVGFGSDDVWLHPVLQARVIDGDTVETRLGLGFGLELAGTRIRIAGIDTAETNRGDTELREHGRAARAYVENWITGCEEPIAMIIDLDGGFGRVLGDLLCDGRRLGADLLQKRLALPYDGTSDRAALQAEHRENARARKENP